MSNTSFDAALLEAVMIFCGAGFVCTHLMQCLLALCERHVVSFGIRNPARPMGGGEYRHCDGWGLSESNLESTAPLVSNLAAAHTTAGSSPGEYHGAKVRGTIEITRFERCHKLREIVFKSSLPRSGRDETTPVRPTSDCDASKFELAHIHFERLAQDSQNRLVIDRPMMMFGLGRKGNFPRLAKLLSNGFFAFFQRRDTIKSRIYVGDLITWALGARGSNDRFILFNAAFSDRYTIEEIISAFCRLSFETAGAYNVPALIIRGLADLLRPLSIVGLGIHRARHPKLIISTNVLPGWAASVGLAIRNRLELALGNWKAQDAGEFLQTRPH